MAEVKMATSALADLHSIYQHIAADSELYAEKVVNNIYERTKLLETHIRIGKMVPEFNSDLIRELLEGKYRIIYTIIDDDEVAVVRVFHGARVLKEIMNS